jgi:metal-responsive CopG/Arc/MetJ family transcriptional regulator
MIRIEPRLTEQLNIKIQPDVIAEIDRAALRLRATRSAVARALIRSELDQLRCSVETSGQ